MAGRILYITLIVSTIQLLFVISPAQLQKKYCETEYSDVSKTNGINCACQGKKDRKEEFIFTKDIISDMKMENIQLITIQNCYKVKLQGNVLSNLPLPFSLVIDEITSLDIQLKPFPRLLQNLTISNVLHFDSTDSSHIIQLRNLKTFKLYNVGSFKNLNLSHIDKVTVENCKDLSLEKPNSLSISDTEAVVIHSNTFQVLGNAAVVLTSITDLSIKDNQFNDTANSSISIKCVINIYLVENSFIRPSGVGIHIHPKGAKRIHIYNNAIHKTAQGFIALMSAEISGDMNIKNNTFYERCNCNLATRHFTKMVRQKGKETCDPSVIVYQRSYCQDKTNNLINIKQKCKKLKSCKMDSGNNVGCTSPTDVNLGSTYATNPSLPQGNDTAVSVGPENTLGNSSAVHDKGEVMQKFNTTADKGDDNTDPKFITLLLVGGFILVVVTISCIIIIAYYKSRKNKQSSNNARKNPHKECPLPNVCFIDTGNDNFIMVKDVSMKDKGRNVKSGQFISKNNLNIPEHADPSDICTDEFYAIQPNKAFANSQSGITITSGYASHST